MGTQQHYLLQSVILRQSYSTLDQVAHHSYMCMLSGSFLNSASGEIWNSPVVAYQHTGDFSTHCVRGSVSVCACNNACVGCHYCDTPVLLLSGGWSGDGCEFISATAAGQVTCKCSHLTNFAVLVVSKQCLIIMLTTKLLLVHSPFLNAFF